MKKYYYGTNQQGPYFEGWYLKFLTRHGDALALIPALHIDRAGRRSASLQVISRNKTWWLEYADVEFFACEKLFQIQVGSSVFTEKNVLLNIEHKACLYTVQYSMAISSTEIGHYGAVSIFAENGMFPRCY